MEKRDHLFLSTALTIMFLLLSTCFLFAEHVDLKKAERVALNLYAERSGDVLKSVVIARVIENKENGETVFYVMEYHPKGFVIVSADDCVQPVLGYSFESSYDEDNMPPAFEWFIVTRLKKQIYAARKAGQMPDKKTVDEWQRLTAQPKSFSPKSVKNVVPLLTTKWGQGTFYNSHCPPDTAGPDGHALVGCVAVAMAQVLNYWEHPWKGSGSHWYTHPDYGTQIANFGNAVYNFDNMPDSPTTYHDDIAQLMYHCAVSVDMDFGPDGSGAWGWGNSDVSNALKDHFYFNSGADDITRSSYSTTWVDKMKEDLDLNRPVIYAGHDNDQDAGHAWVLDAYTTGDMFHCNWGWYGSFDGFYSIDNFSVDGYTFDNYQHACVKIRPKSAHVSGTWDLAGSPYHIYYNHVVDPGDQLIIEPGVEVFFEGRYKLEIKGRLLAVGTPTDSIFFNVSDPDIGSRGIRFINLNDYTADSSKLVYCRIDNGYGNYLYNVMGLGSTYGGGVFCENSSKVLLEHNRIYGGNAGYGGGIACIDTSDIRIRHCVIESCQAVMGGGLYLSESSPMISHNVFRNNQAYSNGGGVYCNWNSPALFYRDTICNNSSLYGGGIGVSFSDAVFEEVVIHHNDVEFMGGGMYVTESDVHLNKSKIYGNTAITGGGGAILCHSNSDMIVERSLIFSNIADTSSAMYIIGSHPLIFHTTVANNLASPEKPAIQIAWGGIDIENSILWNNGSGRIDTAGSCVVSAKYSILQDTAWTGTGVIHQDPQFVSPVNANYQLKWPGFPMPDEGKSPAIDGGNPASPLDPDGTRADMGPYPFEQIYTPLAGGDISGVLTCAGSPYYVNGNLLVPLGEELVIEPCVSLIFKGNYKLEVRGRLLADGTVADRINFAPSDTLTGWRGIRFINTESNSQDSSILRHCRVTYGKGDAGKGGALHFTSSGDVLVANCLLNKNIVTNEGGAVYISGSNGPLFANNVLENNRALSGGGVFGIYTRINLTGNTIQNNSAEFGGAVHIHTSHFNSAGDVFRHNWADLYGGGLYFEAHGSCTFDPVNKSNIYLNYAGAAGLDLFYTGNLSNIKHVVVDTFTVQYLNKHFVYPMQSFTINLSNHVIEQVTGNLYVSPTGSDSNSGTSPSSPLKTMHMACMKILAEEASPRSIWLAEGTYSEGATGEVFPVNWRSYVSMKGAGIDETIIDGEDKNHLLFCYDDSGFTIDSLTFRGGYGQYGGAIRLEEGSSPTINKILVTENHATKTGGGIYCKKSSPYIYDATISHNFAHEYGGGIMAYQYSNPTIVKSWIAHNFTWYGGGGIYATIYSDVTLDSLNIYKNTAANGGGLCFFFVSNGTISNTLIQENQALSHTAGYPGTGGGAHIGYSSSPDFHNTKVLYNEADYRAGGIYASGAIASTFTNCIIEGNSAMMAGGLYVAGGSSGTTRFYNAIISNNSSINGHGGGVYLDGGSQAFFNATITGNTATGTGQGGAVYNKNSNSQFANSILWDNTPNEIHVASGSATAEYCNVEGSYPGTGNIDADPMFNYGTYGPYHLSVNSPCIDAGNPDTTGMSLPSYDFAGNLRIANDTVDMGAIEYQSTAAIRLNLKVFLEGPFNGADMNTDLIGLTGFPLSQPYNTAPWNYPGSESVMVIPNALVVDWVLVELRDAPDAAAAGSSAAIGRQAALLLKNGSVTGLDGSSDLLFNQSVSQSLFTVVWHRNSIGVMSALPLIKNEGVYQYDFTTGASQAFGGVSGHKELVPGVWGMFGGDANADDQITPGDISGVWSVQAGVSGYLSGDFNLDTQVNNTDKNDVWQPNAGMVGQVPD